MTLRDVSMLLELVESCQGGVIDVMSHVSFPSSSVDVARVGLNVPRCQFWT